MNKRIIALLIIVTTLISCNAQKELAKVYNSINCEYTYQSISGIAVSGIKVSNNTSIAQLARVGAAVLSDATSIPFDFTVNLNVKNPSQLPATLHGVQYVITMDDVEFAKGALDKPFDIAAGETAVLPLTVSTNLATLSRTNSQEIIVQIAQNFLGLGSQKSNIVVKLKPTFMIGNTPITSPTYIPVSFSFGGGK